MSIRWRKPFRRGRSWSPDVRWSSSAEAPWPGPRGFGLPQEAVRATGLTGFYAPGQGISGVTFSVCRGEIFGVLGPNGSGKSTLLKTLATRLRPSAGSFSILGLDGRKEAGEIRRRIGFLDDSVAHFDLLTGYENLSLFAGAYGMSLSDVRPWAGELCHRFNLKEDLGRPVRTYSYGMKRKLSLVEALIHRPAVILLDEPSLGLDHAAEVALRDLLARLAAQGATVVLATNDVREAQQVCHRVAFLHRGRLLRVDTPRQLLRELDRAAEIIVSLGAPVSPGEIRCLPGVIAATVRERKLQVVTREPLPLPGLLSRLGELGCPVLGLEVREPTLGDVFLQLTGEGIG